MKRHTHSRLSAPRVCRLQHLPVPVSHLLVSHLLVSHLPVRQLSVRQLPSPLACISRLTSHSQTLLQAAACS